MHRRPVYIYFLNVPSFSSRYFNKIKRMSRLGRLLALSLEILLSEPHNNLLSLSIFERHLFVTSIIVNIIITCFYYDRDFVNTNAI